MSLGAVESAHPLWLLSGFQYRPLRRRSAEKSAVEQGIERGRLSAAINYYSCSARSPTSCRLVQQTSVVTILDITIPIYILPLQRQDIWERLGLLFWGPGAHQFYNDNLTNRSDFDPPGPIVITDLLRDHFLIVTEKRMRDEGLVHGCGVD
jgi:hypothetical protein